MPTLRFIARSYFIAACLASALAVAPGAAQTREAPNTGSPQHVAVFDDAFTVTVRPVPTMHERTRYAETSISADHDELADAAKHGDADAALQLAYALRRCVGAATSDEALDQRVRAMFRTGMVGPPWFPEPTGVDDFAPYIDFERRRLEICRGLTPGQIERAHDWFILAADLGDYGAQVTAMEVALDRFVLDQVQSSGRDPGFEGTVRDMGAFAAGEPAAFRQAARHMLAARAQGSLQALRDLALVYASGALDAPNDHSAAANAYANLLAVAEVWHASMNPGSYRFDEDLARMSRGLSAGERAWAEAEARAILKQEECCRFW